MENKVLVNKSDLTAVGDAVRSQTGESNLLTLGEMESRIRTLSSGGGSNIISGLPTVSTEDNHKILQVVDGEWQKVEPLCYSEISDYTEVLQTTSFETSGGECNLENITLLKEIVNNTVYTVTFDNQQYQTTSFYGDGMYALGNLGILGTAKDTGEPFLLVLITSGLICDVSICAFVDDGTHTFAIHEGVAPVIKIDSPMGIFNYDSTTNAYVCTVESETSLGEFYAETTYIISIDNKIYNIKTIDFAGAVLGGNRALIGMGENTGEEIALGYINMNGVYQYIFATVDEGEVHQIKISELGEIVKTIDSKYLPKDDILAMIDAYMKEALGGVY